MITDLTSQDLPQWMAAAREAALPGISSFAKGLEQYLDAVTNGLTTHWSSGPVEGRVNHFKMIKRQMLGRAGLAPAPQARPARRPELVPFQPTFAL
jgi:transposase